MEYIVGGQMCDDCRRVEANDTWNASVQVRQKGGQRKTLFYLEQLLIKYEATRSCSAIKPNAEGLDFFFGSESGARDGRISCFLSSLFPVYSVLFKKTVSGPEPVSHPTLLLNFCQILPKMAKPKLIQYP